MTVCMTFSLRTYMLSSIATQGSRHVDSSSRLTALSNVLLVNHSSRMAEILAFCGPSSSEREFELRTGCSASQKLPSCRRLLKQCASMRRLASRRLTEAESILCKTCHPSKAAQSRQFATEGAQSLTTRKGPVSLASLGLTALTGAGLLFYFQHLQSQKLKEAALKNETVGTAQIGGPFTLLDQNGNAFTEKDLLGNFALLYFGFTFCPDICPDELEKMAAAIDLIDKAKGREVKPVFISLDPERDTVSQVREYIKEFHAKLIGLTGSMEQVKHVARQYRVYFSKTTDSKDYLVDHSIIMYLINPEGHFVTFYGKNFTAEQLADSVLGHVNSWGR